MIRGRDNHLQTQPWRQAHFQILFAGCRSPAVCTRTLEHRTPELEDSNMQATLLKLSSATWLRQPIQGWYWLSKRGGMYQEEKKI